MALTMIFLYKRCCSKTRSNFYSLKKIFFGLAVSTTLCLHSHQILGTERPSNLSSALLKDGYLNLLLHTKNVVKRGWAGRKIRLKKRIQCFFSVSYLIGFPIVVQLLHSVQALPDSSDKLGPVSETFQTKRRPKGLSFN